MNDDEKGNFGNFLFEGLRNLYLIVQINFGTEII